MYNLKNWDTTKVYVYLPQNNLKQNIMEITYITDTDFIKYELTGDDYSLIYGIIQHSAHNDELKDRYIYNLTVLLCIKQETNVLRTVKSQQWIKLLNNIISNLQSFDKKTLITIPFCNIFGYNISTLINSFSFSLAILNELLLEKFKNMEVIEYINKCYPIQSLKDLFLNLVMEIEVETFENIKATETYIVYDEMIRRGLNIDDIKISPSEHYNENVYYTRFISSTTYKIHPIRIEEDTNIENETVKYKGYDIQRIGVIYYMLHDVLKDNQELLIKVANYTIDKDYISKYKANNAAYKYVHKPSILTDKYWKIQYICKQLERYDIEIPRELIQEKKNLEKL